MTEIELIDTITTTTIETITSIIEKPFLFVIIAHLPLKIKNYFLDCMISYTTRLQDQAHLCCLQRMTDQLCGI